MRLGPTEAERMAEQEDSQEQNWGEGGKEAINLFLWQWLPGSTTLEGAEILSLKVYQLIADEYNHHRNRRNAK